MAISRERHVGHFGCQLARLCDRIFQMNTAVAWWTFKEPIDVRRGIFHMCTAVV